MARLGSRATTYLDHAASSWPKPPEVVEAVRFALRDLGGNPGRGAYELAMQSARAVHGARRDCSTLLGVERSANLIFVPSCTFGCNQMLFGLLEPGDRVVVGSAEHNAVARPLNALASRGVEVVMTRVDGAGLLDPHDVETAVRQKPTRAVICQHASNVTGAIQPIADLADIAHDNGSVMLVDGAQGAGHLPVDIAKLGADAYATSGHKGLLGPQGIGLLYLSPAIDPQPLIEGGTGSGDSESERMPARRPERFEAGTMNVPGIVGLGAATRWLLEHGAEQRATERRLVERLHAGLSALPGITVLGPSVGVERVPVLTFVHERIDADHIALRLDHGYGIATRAGLHCAPWAHEAAGTLDRGAVRMGVGYGNTDEHITAALDALAEIIAGAT